MKNRGISLKDDAFRAIIATLVILPLVAVLYHITNFVFLDLARLGFILGTMISLTALVVTIYAFLFTIESQRDENPVIQMLRNENRYDELMDRFQNSLKGMIVSIVVLLSIYFYPQQNLSRLYGFVLTAIMLYFLVFFLLRFYRCAYLFLRIEQVSRKIVSES